MSEFEEKVLASIFFIFATILVTIMVTQGLSKSFYAKQVKALEEKVKSEIQFEAVSKGFGEFEIQNGEVVFLWKE